MSIKRDFRKFLWKLGYDLSRVTTTSHNLSRRRQLLKSYGIDTVLDIGANSGQFAHQLRCDIGYAHRIMSFEPLTSAFKTLEAQAQNDATWEVFNFAIGDTEDKREINIAGNSYSSSLLPMLPTHLKALPESKYIGREVIHVRTMDSIFGHLCRNSSHIYMKIDTQGFESQVLKGAENSLRYIDTVQMELSLVPLYDGELLFDEMCLVMRQKDYTLVAIENGFSDTASGQLLQVDGIFHRF